MPNTYKIAVIGAGRPWKTEGATGFGMSHRHWIGFKSTGKAELAAVCDLVPERAQAYANDHNPAAKLYADYKKMMAEVKPDFVCVSLWPHLHATTVCEVAPYSPKGILCEKPMDVDWDAALRMHLACQTNGVALMINHQRRFNKPFMEAKRLLDSGAVGKLVRLEGGWHNFQDSGTHCIDMLFNFAGDAEAEWVLAQADARGGRKVFGALQETHGLISWRFKTGVRATYFAGKNYADLGCLIRAVGETGVIEVMENGPNWVRLRKDGGAWEHPDTGGESIHDNAAIDRGIQDFVDAVEQGRPPVLGSQNAIRPTEVIFAAYESALRRTRIDLPLPPGPSALRKLAAEAGVDF
jgi:predicted dehydrogenase